MAEDENMQKLKGKRLCIMAVVVFMLIAPVQPLLSYTDGNAHTTLITIDGEDDASYER